MADVATRCAEQLSAAVLDAGELLSLRGLSAAAQADAADSCAALEQFAKDRSDEVAPLSVVIERQGGQGDPRSRVIRLRAGPVDAGSAGNDVLSSQIYAVYPKKQHVASDSLESTLATLCWSQERKARNEIFGNVKKHAPMTRSMKAFYGSEIVCTEATARTEFGDEKGEEAVSVFDSIKKAKKSVAAAPSSTSFFKSNSSAGKNKSTGSSSRPTAASATITMTKSTKPDVKKLSAESMMNVLSVDSSDEEGSDKEENDAPVFVKQSHASSRSKRVISDDEDMDEDDNQEEVATHSKGRASSHNGKRKLESGKTKEERPAERNANANDSGSDDPSPTKKARSVADEVEIAPIDIPTKRSVLVTKTRINEQGYMVTEKTYEEVELTAEEVEKERKAAVKKQQAAAAQRKKAANDKAGAGPRKQKDLRSFFMKK